MTREEAQKAAAEVLEGFDQQVFVRNTDNDHRSDWAVRQSRFIVALAKLRQFADEPLP